MKFRKRNITAPWALAALALLAASPAIAATSCGNLASLTLPEVTSIKATLVTSGTITLTGPR